MIAKQIIVTLILLFSIPVVAQSNDPITSHRLAPNFELEDIDGNTFELKENLGRQIILLSFYASICKPCRDQTEAFSKIYNKYKDEGLVLIAISTDDQKTVAKVKPYIKSKGYSFPVLYDINNDAARIYYALAVPYSVIIDKNGRIVYTHLGYMKGDEIEVENKVKELLEE